MSTEQFKVKLGTLSKDKKTVIPNAPRPVMRMFLLKDLLAWIDQQDFDVDVKEHLRRAASRYPQQALRAFQKNFLHHVEQAKKACAVKPKN